MTKNHLSNPKQTKKTKALRKLMTSLLYGERLTLFQFISKFSYQTPVLEISVEDLSKHTGIPERSVSRYKKELEDNDLIRKRRRIKGCNFYWLNPEFTNNAGWNSVLSEFCPIWPVFKSVFSYIAILCSVYCSLGFGEPIKNNLNTPSSSPDSVTQLSKVDTQEIQKGETRASWEQDLPLNRLRAIEFSLCEESKAVKLVESICELFRELGIEYDFRDECDLHGYSYRALVAGCGAITRATEREGLKELFWNELKKAHEEEMIAKQGVEVATSTPTATSGFAADMDITDEDGSKTERLIDKTCELLKSRGAVVSEELELDMYCFPYDAIVTAYDTLLKAHDAQFPLAVFFKAIRAATIAVPGRLPDYAKVQNKRDEGKIILWLPKGVSMHEYKPLVDVEYPADMLFYKGLEDDGSFEASGLIIQSFKKD